ncbi:Ulp1_protease family protein [Hexamita inflata]|uniref:Ulp1_protease family protein n=1 Tax=Hexamita inflata TaxID=28002 RepID=A0ABP1K2E8_9EUKA
MDAKLFIQQNQIIRDADACYVREIFQKAQKSEYFTKRYPIEAYKALIKGQWLNDETLYEYTLLLQRNSFAMNSHFYEQLTKQKYDNALRWITQIKDPKYKHILCFPINLQNVHWVAIGVDFKLKTIIYSDSMGKYQSDIVKPVLDFILNKKSELEKLTNTKITTFTLLSRENAHKVDQNFTVSENRSQLTPFTQNKCPQQQIQFDVQKLVKIRAQSILSQQNIEDSFDQQYKYLHFAADMPRQNNCDDCGVFSALFLRWFSGFGSDFQRGELSKEQRNFLADEIIGGIGIADM